jgi:hypothetical protein
VIETSVAIRAVIPSERPIEDYLEAYTWFRWHSWAWPALTTFYLLACVASLLIAGSDVAVYVVVWGLALAGAYFIGLRHCASKMQVAHRRIGEATYIFKADGFEAQSSAGQSQTFWTAVDRVIETRRSFLIVFANTLFFLIPKRCVVGNDPATLRTLFKDKLGERARVEQEKLHQERGPVARRQRGS